MRIWRISCIPGLRERSLRCKGLGTFIFKSFGTSIIIDSEYERYYSEIKTGTISYECSSETCLMFQINNGVELKEESVIKAIMRPVYAKSAYMIIDWFGVF